MTDLFKHAVIISSFVVVMMLVIEYLNVLTSGAWQRKLAEHKWGGYILASFLGAVPGCLGAFAVVAMYSHGALTYGALVAAMIATSGDEAFLMLALIPKQALVLTALLVAVGITAGALVDAILGRRTASRAVSCEGFEVHPIEQCECFPRGRMLEQWRQCSAARGILAVTLALLVASVLTGQLGPSAWNWVRATLAVVTAGALFIVTTVPDHFLEKHLWEHVARKHAPRIFLWTLSALLATHLLTEYFQVGPAIQQGKWAVLVAACLIGLIPESGPHMVFVALYAQGAIPFSILLANSISQDGHGMLPLLAHSRREFFTVKAIGAGAGISIGAAAMAAGL